MSHSTAYLLNTGHAAGTPHAQQTFGIFPLHILNLWICVMPQDNLTVLQKVSPVAGSGGASVKVKATDEQAASGVPSRTPGSRVSPALQRARRHSCNSAIWQGINHWTLISLSEAGTV